MTWINKEELKINERRKQVSKLLKALVIAIEEYEDEDKELISYITSSSEYRRLTDLKEYLYAEKSDISL